MPWFVKLEKGVVDKAIFDRYVPEHKAYVKDLINQGYKIKTGYWTKLGGGMMVFKAASLEEAKEIVAQDPLIKYGCVKYQLHEWIVVA